jgi:hypothetical protein
VFIGFKCQSDFRDKIVDAAPGALSQFIRDAVMEKLARENAVVDRSLAKAPSRIGIGGRPSHKGNSRSARYDVAPALPPAHLNENAGVPPMQQQQQAVSYRPAKRKKK